MKARDIILCALFAALTAVGAFIKIPVPVVPFTLQFFFCAMAGVFLGSRLGAISQAVYVAVGLVGVPVFTQGGGFDYVLKPTFGYLLGFILCAFLIGLLVERMRDMRFWPLFGAALAGMLGMFLLGVPYLYVVYNLYLGQMKDVAWALTYGFLVFLPGDIFLSAAAAFAAKKLVPLLRRNNYVRYRGSIKSV
jgi:biotin transport system substrate-specific component